MDSFVTPEEAIDHRDLLQILRQHPLTQPFNLAFYSKTQTHSDFFRTIRSVCPTVDNESPCSPMCYKSWGELVSDALSSEEPLVKECLQGHFQFAIPLSPKKGFPDCLIGGGVYQKGSSAGKIPGNNDKNRLADLIDSKLTQEIESLTNVQDYVQEIARVLPQLLEKNLHSLSLSRTTQKLEAVQTIVRELTDSNDCEHVIAIVREALIVLFDLPRILIALQQTGQPVIIHSTLGLGTDVFPVEQKAFTHYLDTAPHHHHDCNVADLEQLFPGLDVNSARLFPIAGDGKPVGAVIVLDDDLHPRDLTLIELLVQFMAARLDKLKTQENHRQQREHSTRMVTMISTLSLVNSREELYQQILEMSAELLTASSGSLMLLDETSGSLNIVAAKGMTSSLAKTMSVAFGDGIAGKVAKSGFPLLVNDIEHDRRVATRNRPRFKTKSFVSIPLDIDGRLTGVLNLADKNNGAHFTEEDLSLVQMFTSHAVLLIDRAATLEKAGKFEQLAITDPLTGLYNRRFLEDRIQEEFNRSKRLGQSFCLILADLDSFKLYNDICGHLAGDNALRKVASLMKMTARDMDIIVRYGGEEFCIILPATNQKEGVFVGERLRKAIESEPFPGESHLPLGRLTTSIGIASFPQDGTTSNKLIHAADLALYRAKAMGRNRLVSYDPSLEEDIVSKASE